jgi:DNA-binding PadR family transcriptional regulator
MIAMPKLKLSPLPAAAFHILMSLADDDLHGYEIMRRVEEQTGGRTRMGPGTLYSSIQALLDAEFIAEVTPRRDEGPGDTRRRYYHLTAAGRKAAREEAERLADVLRLARAKKILRGDHV